MNTALCLVGASKHCELQGCLTIFFDIFLLNFKIELKLMNTPINNKSNKCVSYQIDSQVIFGFCVFLIKTGRFWGFFFHEK